MINCFDIAREDSRLMLMTREKPILMRKVNSSYYSRVMIILNGMIHLARANALFQNNLSSCFAVSYVYVCVCVRFSLVTIFQKLISISALRRDLSLISRLRFTQSRIEHKRESCFNGYSREITSDRDL